MSTNPTPIQFDNADYGQGPPAPGGVTCAACKRTIVDQYFEATSQVFCTTCADILGAEPQGGSRFWRTIEAIILGTIGGIVGAVIWYLILKFTGFQVGLIAILVGLLVGAGVRKGSRNRGGWFYQLMAVALTYLAVVSTYVPLILEDDLVEAQRNHERLVNGGEEHVKIAVMLDGRILLNGLDASRQQWLVELSRVKENNGFVYYYGEGRSEGLPRPAAADDVDEIIAHLELERVAFQDAGFTIPLYETESALASSTSDRVFLYVMLAIMALVLPFFMVKESIISLFILGIALWQAWVINRKPNIKITGPFVLSPSESLGAGSIVHVPPPVTPPSPPSSFDESSRGPTPT